MKNVKFLLAIAIFGLTVGCKDTTKSVGNTTVDSVAVDSVAVDSVTVDSVAADGTFVKTDTMTIKE